MSILMRCLTVMVGHLLFFDQLALARPEWSEVAPTIQGKDLKIVCRGVGPSLAQASGRSIEACQAEAANFIRSDVYVKTLVVQTEKDSAIHEEVRSSANFENLKCSPGRRELDEKDQTFTIYQECLFDLSKITINKGKEKKYESNVLKFDKGPERLVSVSSAPQCESVVVEGASVSVTRCHSNPVQVRVPNGAVDLIVRASGYLPKKVRVLSEMEDIHVTLDPN